MDGNGSMAVIIPEMDEKQINFTIHTIRHLCVHEQFAGVGELHLPPGHTEMFVCAAHPEPTTENLEFFSIQYVSDVISLALTFDDPDGEWGCMTPGGFQLATSIQDMISVYYNGA